MLVLQKERNVILSSITSLLVGYVDWSVNMEVKKIKLNEPDEVKDFVNAASQCDFDIDIFYNRIIVDAKSFLGVLSLDLNRELSVTCRGYNPKFEHTLKKYSAM